MADFFHHRNGIGLFFRILAQLNEFIEEFIDIGHVKVTGQHQVTTDPVVQPQKWMYGLDGIAAMGPITKVAQQYFTRIGHVFFQPIGIV